jgi:hypothetical protein
MTVFGWNLSITLASSGKKFGVRRAASDDAPWRGKLK